VPFKFKIKKSLKIPKGKSESVYRRRIDNTMAKRKKYQRTNNDLQNIHEIDYGGMVFLITPLVFSRRV
jgi:hypothetical protein